MKEKRCPACEKGKLVTVDDIISQVERYVFVETGERCTHCDEEFINESEGQKMINLAKKLGVWGEPSNVTSEVEG